MDGRSTYPTARGQSHFRPLIKASGDKPAVLSFWNLVEAHVLRALRTEHGISIQAVRQAIDYSERKLQIERLLLSPELRSGAGRLFLDRYGELIDLEPSGQLAIRQVFEAHRPSPAELKQNPNALGRIENGIRERMFGVRPPLSRFAYNFDRQLTCSALMAG